MGKNSSFFGHCASEFSRWPAHISPVNAPMASLENRARFSWARTASIELR